MKRFLICSCKLVGRILWICSRYFGVVFIPLEAIHWILGYAKTSILAINFIRTKYFHMLSYYPSVVHLRLNLNKYIYKLQYVKLPDDRPLTNWKRESVHNGMKQFSYFYGPLTCAWQLHDTLQKAPPNSWESLQMSETLDI